MDVKSAILYGKVKEEVYVGQPPGFEDPIQRDKVYVLNNALYGLHQAPRQWYEELSTYLISKGFKRGLVDCSLFTKKSGDDLLLVQIYVDDIIFGSTNELLYRDFETVMQEKFEMRAMGEMQFFLGLQVDQRPTGIFIHQTKYVSEVLSRFQMEDSKPMDTPIQPNHGIGVDAKGC